MSFRVDGIGAALAVVLLAAGGCAGRRAVGPGPERAHPAGATVGLGACADPATDGMVGERIVPRRADRDLDGDGRAEVVVADRTLCTHSGNCYWNVFGRLGKGCQRYLGTVAGVGIERLQPRGDLGFHDLRSWWRLAGDDRFLLQRLRFRGDGYRLVEVLVCRKQKDDRLLCAEDKR